MDKNFVELKRLKEIIYLIPGNVYWKDAEGRFLGCNNNVAKILKLSSPEEIIGKFNEELFNKKLAKQADEIDRKVIENNSEIVAEEIGLSIKGEEAVYFTRKIPLHDERGNPNGVLGISVDITDKKYEETRLNKAYQEIKKINSGLKLIAASIAHELRTPLSAISSAVTGITKHLPHLLKAYCLAKEHNLYIPFIPTYRIDLLSSLSNNIQQEIKSANLVINMLLTKINKYDKFKKEILVNSISNCINEALTRYPLSKKEQNLIHFKSDNDFKFRGSSLLIIHIFFNLIKNSLYYIKAANKGEINIWLETSATFNKVYFKDTGQGIPLEILPFIFDRFYTKTRGGAGIGLAFCKETMNEINGDIICYSTEGEFTQFELIFPI